MTENIDIIEQSYFNIWLGSKYYLAYHSYCKYTKTKISNPNLIIYLFVNCWGDNHMDVI